MLGARVVCRLAALGADEINDLVFPFAAGVAVGQNDSNLKREGMRKGKKRATKLRCDHASIEPDGKCQMPNAELLFEIRAGF